MLSIEFSDPVTITLSNTFNKILINNVPFLLNTAFHDVLHALMIHKTMVVYNQDMLESLQTAGLITSNEDVATVTKEFEENFELIVSYFYGGPEGIV